MSPLADVGVIVLAAVLGTAAPILAQRARLVCCGYVVRIMQCATKANTNLYSGTPL